MRFRSGNIRCLGYQLGTLPVLIRYSLKVLWVAFFLSASMAHADAPKEVVGAIEVVQVEESGMRFQARVDTGAKTSSIHAEKIEVNGSGDPRGALISFDLVDQMGKRQRVESHVVSVVKIRTSEGADARYVVPLTIRWHHSHKTVRVTLNDRKRMKYRLLLGRNWLRGDFIVDVEKNSDD